MGCDIHGPYLEIRNNRSEDGWESVARFKCGRDYRLFRFLSGGTVCSFIDSEEDSALAPKGIPLNMGWQAFDEYMKYFAKDPIDDDTASLEKAREWVEKKYSRYLGGTMSYRTLHDSIPVGVDTGYITEPDWHSASWLDYDELSSVVQRYSDAIDEEQEGARVPASIRMMLAAMGEDRDNSRIVFWFDN